MNRAGGNLCRSWRGRAGAVLALLPGLAAAILWQPGGAGAQTHAGHGAGAAAAGIEPAAVVLPPLDGAEVIGQRVFAAKCAACHAASLTGVEGAGPPLLHPYYVPGHHSDTAIENAVRHGAPAHHWTFGDMPPVKGLTGADIAAVIAYVRAVQQANGIR